MAKNNQQQNKHFIWITCVLSVLAHLIAAITLPTFERAAFKKPSLVSQSTLKITLKQPVLKQVKKKQQPPPKTIQTKNDTIIEKKPKKQPAQKKPVKKPQEAQKPKKKEPPKAEKKLIPPDLSAPMTSKKSVTPKEKKATLGDTVKGKRAKNKKTPTPKKIIGKKQPQNIEKASTPQKTPKKELKPEKPKPLIHTSKSLTPKTTKKKRNPISFSAVKKNTEKKTANRDKKYKDNPLFAAIKSSTPAQQLNTQELGKLKLIDEQELDQARIGDPFSQFEHQRRQVHNQYLAIMSGQVNKYWLAPESSQPLRARIRLYLAISGLIKDIYIEESSGNLAFDQQAITAIKSVQRFQMPENKTFASYFTRLTMTVDNYNTEEQ